MIYTFIRGRNIKTKQIDNPPIILICNKSDLVFNNHDKGRYATYNANNPSVNKNTILSALDDGSDVNQGTSNSVSKRSSLLDGRQHNKQQQILGS